MKPLKNQKTFDPDADTDAVEMDEVDPHTGKWRKSGQKTTLREHAHHSVHKSLSPAHSAKSLDADAPVFNNTEDTSKKDTPGSSRKGSKQSKSKKGGKNSRTPSPGAP